jgi:hypothetical protein
MTYGEVISENLFERVLLDPTGRGASELFVSSGYASAAMVSRHFAIVSKEMGRDLSIDLHVGMSGRDGLSRSTLLGLQAIPRQIAGREFNCTLSPRGVSNHSKVYVWCDETGPREAYLGSSNYTQLGFGVTGSSPHHSEVCTPIDPEMGMKYVLASSKNGIGYKSSDVFEYIDIVDDFLRQTKIDEDFHTNSDANSDFVELPLIMVRGKEMGEVHSRSGLNWGQRENRNPNQAYIPVPASISKSGFFPEKGVHFQVSTDDGEAFLCTVAQDGDKAIETPTDNSIIGLYFRRRLGLPSGARVMRSDLDRYGATSVRFTRRDFENYELSFQPGMKAPLPDEA